MNYLDRVWVSLTAEKALSLASLGGILLLTSFFGGHLDERLRFPLDFLAVCAFGSALFCEKNAAARMAWVLLCSGSLIFAQMDLRMSHHLTQARSDKTFESR